MERRCRRYSTLIMAFFFCLQVTEEGKTIFLHNIEQGYNGIDEDYNGIDEEGYNVSEQPLTDQWLTECAKKMSQHHLQPFNIQRENYTVGDCIKLCTKCAWGANPHSGEVFPNWTIAGHYALLACSHPERQPLHMPKKGGNLEVVDKVFRIFEKQVPGFVQPPKGAVVIHLRLGDVIERSNNTVEEMLTKGGNPFHHPSQKNSIKSVYEYLSNLEQANATQVIIVGGSHYTKYYKKSRVYAGCLEKALRHSGKNVSMNLDGGDADREFFFMSHAAKVIVSTGGYSRLIGKMVKYYGGTIIGRAF